MFRLVTSEKKCVEWDEMYKIKTCIREDTDVLKERETCQNTPLHSIPEYMDFTKENEWILCHLFDFMIKNGAVML